MNRWVVVTGASSGIGAAYVDSFRESGWGVIGVDIAEHSTADDHLKMDLADSDCGWRLHRHIDGREVGGLVNNAAVGLDRPASETTADDFDRIYEVNLRAPLLLSSALLPSLAASDGFVVNVASVHAIPTSTAVSAYAATKGGLVALTRALAVEWAPDVRVNAVLPGAVESDMLERGLKRTSSTVESLGLRTPMRRVGRPEEIADAVLFLSHNSFVTGAALVVDGGAVSHLSTE